MSTCMPMHALFPAKPHRAPTHPSSIRHPVPSIQFLASSGQDQHPSIHASMLVGPPPAAVPEPARQPASPPARQPATPTHRTDMENGQRQSAMRARTKTNQSTRPVRSAGCGDRFLPAPAGDSVVTDGGMGAVWLVPLAQSSRTQRGLAARGLWSR